jgi:SAM-dependent methyltransferase
VSVDPLAAEGFTGAAAAYERGRPGYPPEAVEILVRELDLRPGRLVLDLAAGSGKFTRALVGTGAAVVAVEPIDAMRETLAASLPEVRALPGTAEEIPLPDRAVDAVTVAQAFHWFDGERALAEIHRVLAPRGRLALVWNWRDQSDPLMERLTELMEPYRRGVPSYASMNWREAFERTELFTPLEEAHVPHPYETDREGIVARVASVSFIADLPDEERERLLEDVRALVPRDQVVARYRTDVYWCDRV